VHLHRVGIEPGHHRLELQVEPTKILCSREAQLDSRHKHMFAYGCDNNVGRARRFQLTAAEQSGGSLAVDLRHRVTDR
jgi:hypothetical protein